MAETFLGKKTDFTGTVRQGQVPTAVEYYQYEGNGIRKVNFKHSGSSFELEPQTVLADMKQPPLHLKDGTLP